MVDSNKHTEYYAMVGNNKQMDYFALHIKML